jgi:hypothetical protein
MNPKLMNPMVQELPEQQNNEGVIGGNQQLEEANAVNPAIVENAENELPALEQLLPGDLLQEIDQVPQVNLNLQVGFMRHQESRLADPVFEAFSMSLVAPQPPADFFRFWGRYFSPLGNPRSPVAISVDWAPFFTVNLLKIILSGQGSFLPLMLTRSFRMIRALIIHP